MTGARIVTLIGRGLDRPVADAERVSQPAMRSAFEWMTVPPAYSTDPRVGQPLIERLGIASGRVLEGGWWWAVVPGCELGAVGPTQLVACCRARLVSLYGDFLPS